MKKILYGAGATLGVLLVVAAMWYYRPWSPYSPAKVLETRDETIRIDYYRDMESYFPHRTIEGAEDAQPLPRDLQPLNISYTHEGQTRTLEQYGEEFDITGLMVVKGGRVLYEQYWRGNDAESRATSWSVAKSFVATLIGAAVKEGRIDSLDDPVETYAPQFAGTHYGETSIRDVMAMATGIDFNENYEETGSDIRRLFFNTFILNRDIDNQVKIYERDRDAGQEFKYISSNTVVLGAVVTGAYEGRTLTDLASEKIFKPMGMADATWLTDRNADDAKELAYCCIQARLEDYARFGMMYTESAPAGAAQVIPADWGRFVGTPPAESHFEDAMTEWRKYGYGHHFWVPDRESGQFFAAGYNGQFVYIDPENDVVVAITSADLKYPLENQETLKLKQAAVQAALEF